MGGGDYSSAVSAELATAARNRVTLSRRRTPSAVLVLLLWYNAALTIAVLLDVAFAVLSVTDTGRGVCALQCDIKE